MTAGRRREQAAPDHAPWRVQRTDAPLTSLRLRALRDYWLAARGNRPMPGRPDIDPVDIPQLLPYLLLVDVFSEPQRFRYRLVGTALTQLADRDPTGRWLDTSLYGDNLERVLFEFRRCADTGQPVATVDTTMYLPNDWYRVEALLLPLGGTDGDVAMILAGVEIVGEAEGPPDSETILLLDWRG